MRIAEKADKNKVVKIIIESFDKNPHINTLVKNDKKRNARMVVLAEYAFELGFRRKGVYLTDDDLGVAIIYPFHEVTMNIREYLFQLKLVFKTFTLQRAFKINQLENQIKNKRAKNVNFLYLWFFGVANEALGSNDARILMKFIFTLSKEQELPIYLETSIKRNSIIYKRYGFETYDLFETGQNNLSMWYMKRPHNIPF